MNERARVGRRTLFAAGGAGAFALAGLAVSGRAGAAELTAVEKANVKLIDDYCKGWGVEKPEAEKLAAAMSDDCKVDLGGTHPKGLGRAALVEYFKSFLTHGEHYELKILDTWAKGPVVVNSRIDTTITPGKPNESIAVVGVFVIKDGKIVSWNDYGVPKA